MNTAKLSAKEQRLQKTLGAFRRMIALHNKLGVGQENQNLEASFTRLVDLDFVQGIDIKHEELYFGVVSIHMLCVLAPTFKKEVTVAMRHEFMCQYYFSTQDTPSN